MSLYVVLLMECDVRDQYARFCEPRAGSVLMIAIREP